MHCPDAFHESNPIDATRIAESVRADLGALLEIVERQLSHASEADEMTLTRLKEAKAAAERGVKLSDRLVEMLRRGR